MTFGLLAAPLVAMSTLGYVHIKSGTHREYYSRNGIRLSDITLCMLLVYCAYLVAFCVAGSSRLTVVGYFMAYVLAVDTAYRACSLAKALRTIERRADVGCHVHTSHSHDGEMSIAGLRTAMEARRWQAVYLAEHAEDFEAGSYALYRDQCREASTAGALLVPGLEYPVAEQHVLALGLKDFCPLAPSEPAEIRKLYAAAERVVWAHPNIALRRLYDLPYVWRTLRIGMFCEAVEWRNRKSERTERNALRSKCLCLALCWIHPGHRLICAEDAHRYSDLAVDANLREQRQAA